MTINKTLNTAISVVNAAVGKNRIINGDMRIDQRNAGASVTPAASTQTWMTDRFSVLGTQASKFSAQQNAGSVTPPPGFSNYLGITSLSSYASISTDLFRIFHTIEGYNIVDFAWGSSSAKPITISFWVRSSLTGTFGGCLQNQSNNRAYAFTYTISVANNWEFKTVTIAGETSGTWYTNNTVGLAINFDLGSGSTKQIAPGSWQAVDANAPTGGTSIVGTSGATFYITGIQLEVGSVATPFERRPYTTELQLCQRYLPAYISSSTNSPLVLAFNQATTQSIAYLPFLVNARVPPTGIVSSAASTFVLYVNGVATVPSSVSFGGVASTTAGQVNFGVTGVTAGQAQLLYFNSASAYLYFTGCEL